MHIIYTHTDARMHTHMHTHTYTHTHTHTHTQNMVNLDLCECLLEEVSFKLGFEIRQSWEISQTYESYIIHQSPSFKTLILEESSENLWTYQKMCCSQEVCCVLCHSMCMCVCVCAHARVCVCAECVCVCVCVCWVCVCIYQNFIILNFFCSCQQALLLQKCAEVPVSLVTHGRSLCSVARQLSNSNTYSALCCHTVRCSWAV